jgi:diguanylate cyclase (GGDEF)-like protein
MDKAELLRQQLEGLAASFRQRLAEELPALAALAGSLPPDGEDGKELLALRDRLHKLAGSAGTFGYPRVGSKARELEQLATACLKRQPHTEGARATLLAGVAELAQLHETETPPAIPSNALGEKLAATPSSQLIDVLEEDQDLASRMSKTLESFGYRVTHHATRQSLKRALKTRRPDALVLDISRGSAGEGLLKGLGTLQSDWSPPIPVIAISDSVSFDDQLEAVRGGAQGYFSKPVDLAALENRLERCFNSLQSEPFRIMIVDDDVDLARRFEAVLSSADMLVESVIDPRRLLDQMEAFLPDVILMDVNMPEFSGPELAQVIRLHDNWLRVPIVYLSAETDVVRQMDALLRAGDDFITKPISDDALLTTVYSRAQRARLVSQALSRDSLTGLLKHADIKEQVELEIERAQRQHLPVSIAMIDIDHFKQVNDRHGHAVGDNVICALANLLRQRLRKIDRLGRYGGEEFVAVLPNCSADSARAILDEIRRAFNALEFSGSEGAFHCTFSAGISACQAPSWQGEGQLELADESLYEAKSLGRNRIIVHLRP